MENITTNTLMTECWKSWTIGPRPTLTRLEYRGALLERLRIAKHVEPYTFNLHRLVMGIGKVVRMKRRMMEKKNLNLKTLKMSAFRW